MLAPRSHKLPHPPNPQPTPPHHTIQPMPRKDKGSRKKRVDFRPNRGPAQDRADWTQRYHADDEQLADTERGQMVGGKSETSRKRTILVDENELPLVDEAQWLRGRVTRVYGSVCDVYCPPGRAWQCAVRRVLRTRLIEQRSPVAVGDEVWISDQARHHDGGRGDPSVGIGVIERVSPRRSVLSRSDFRGREHVLVANCDQLIIVTSVAQPSPKPHLVDRYLVAAARGALRPVIVFNKSDLEMLPGSPAPAEPETADDESAPVDALIGEYTALGYRCLRASAVGGEGIEDLRAELRDRTSVFSGQSGVGKSSLINALQPGLNLRVQEVSLDNEKGRHTTTQASLIALDHGGFVVDTPGIRQFDLWKITPGELEGCFVELAPLVAQCRFRDCHHSGETGCAIAAAVESGAISPRRYASYLKMLDELANPEC